MNFEFMPLQPSHFVLIEKWLNAPHIKQWWSPPHHNELITLQVIEKKLGPRLGKNSAISCFILLLDKQPAGYIQVYNARTEPREGYNLSSIVSEDLSSAQRLAALDFYIGEIKFIGKGYGTLMLECFLKKHVAPFYDACIVDTATENKIALRSLEKVGFTAITEVTISPEKINLLLFKKLTCCVSE